MDQVLSRVPTPIAHRESAACRYVSPRFDMPCKITLPPDPFARVQDQPTPRTPSKLNAFGSPMVATAAVAVSNPTPAISLMALTALSSFFHSRIWRSICATCSSSFFNPIHCSRSESITTAGNRSATRSSTAGIARPRAARLLPIISPYSVSNPRRLLTCIVRNLMSCWRIRCSANIACCVSSSLRLACPVAERRAKSRARQRHRSCCEC